MTINIATETKKSIFTFSLKHEDGGLFHTMSNSNYKTPVNCMKMLVTRKHEKSIFFQKDKRREKLTQDRRPTSIHKEL